MTTGQEFFSIEQLAERYGLSVKFFRREIWSGKLVAKRFGRAIRVSVDEIQRWEAARPAA